MLNTKKPEWFTDWQDNQSKKAEGLPADFTYGLAIGSKPESDLAKSTYVAPEYVVEKKGEVKEYSWSEAMSDQSVSETIKKFLTSDLPFASNRHFGHLVGLFREGMVVVAENGESVVDIKTSATDNFLDVVFIIARENSSVTVRDMLSSEAVKSETAGRNIFILAEAGAHVEYGLFQNISKNTSAFIHTLAVAHDDARIKFLGIHTGGKFVKSDMEVFLEGKNSHGYGSSITVAGGEQVFDLYNAVHGNNNGAQAELRSSGVLGSKSKVISRDFVGIPRGVKGVKGVQSARFILTSSDCEIDAVPALDVASNEVVSSHALSIRALTSVDLLYPMLRGIPPFVSERLILEGVLENSLKQHGETMADSAVMLIDKKLGSHVFST